MRPKFALLALSVAACLVAGCSSSPIKTNGASSSGQLALVGASAIIGGAAGAAIDDGEPVRGAAIGAATGALVSGVGSKIFSSSRAKRDAEIAADAARKERVAIIRKVQASAAAAAAADEAREEREAAYVRRGQTVTDPAGIYEGVPYFERTRAIGDHGVGLQEQSRR